MQTWLDDLQHLSRKHWLLLLALAWLLVLLTELQLRQDRDTKLASAQQELSIKAAQLRATIETELNAPLRLGQSLVAYVQARQGELQDKELQVLLPNLFAQNRFIRNFGLAPGNRIQVIYPLAGNESALGLYYPDIPTQWPVIAQSIKSGTPHLDGPFPLKQGGRGLVFRTPVFLPDNNYWGMVSTVMNADAIWQQLSALATDLNLKLVIETRRRSGNEPAAQLLFGEPLPTNALSQQLQLSIANAKWQLVVQPLYQLPSQALWWRLGGYGLALVMVGLVLSLFVTEQRRQQAQQLSKQQEHYYQTLLEHVADAIIVLDAKGMVQTVNQAAEILLQRTTAQLTGQSYPHLFVEPFVLEDSVFWETAVQDADGNHIDVELLCRQVQLGQQKFSLLLLRDIRARKKVERLKNEFIATVSHELRTPLTALQGALALLNHQEIGQASETGAKLLQIAKSNADHLLVLINDILDLQRLQSGRIQLQLTAVALLPSLQLCLQRHDALLVQKSLQVNIHSNLTDEDRWSLDETRWQQILSNLVSNAIRYSPQGGQLQLELIRRQHEKTTLQLKVADQGPGVPAEFVPHLFEKFSQADASDSRAKAGSGLGLSICQRLVSLHGGRIYYETASLGGACFVVEFVL